MKKLFYLMLLIPMLVISQNTENYSVFENTIITVNPTKAKEFLAGMEKHNKKYHDSGIYGARVYFIANGKNSGKYVWSMGPLKWSEFDKRPDSKDHNQDWINNVLPYTLAQDNTTYWKFKAKLSNFPKDFTIKNLLINVFDVKRFKKENALKLIKQIHKVMVEKLPSETFGIYTNEFGNSTDGTDIAYASFFNKYNWLGEDNKFVKKYDEVYGEGSFAHFLKDWGEVTKGSTTELWNLQPKLSGNTAVVKAINRQ